MNKFIEPMLASKPKEGKGICDYSPSDYVLEEKFDGHRLVIRIEAGKSVTAWSRVGNERTTLSPKLTNALKTRLPTSTLDSELYLPGGTSTDVTRIENLPKLKIVFFDVLMVGEASAMNEKGMDRRSLLVEACSKLDCDGPLSVAEQYDPSEEVLRELWNRGGEGGILKKRNAVYRSGTRSKDWIKLKKEGSAKIRVTGFEEGLSGRYSKVVGISEDGHPACVKSLNRRWRQCFERDPKKYVGETLLIDFQMRTADGSFRHPMADRFEKEGLTPR